MGNFHEFSIAMFDCRRVLWSSPFHVWSSADHLYHLYLPRTGSSKPTLSFNRNADSSLLDMFIWPKIQTPYSQRTEPTSAKKNCLKDPFQQPSLLLQHSCREITLTHHWYPSGLSNHIDAWKTTAIGRVSSIQVDFNQVSSTNPLESFCTRWLYSGRWLL